MTISIWRYSHLTLAVSSFLLLTLASVTGIILSFQPLTEKIQPYRAANFNELSIAQTIPSLRKVYPGITELSVDANQFVQIKGSDANGENLQVYVNPENGKILGKPKKENEFFQWVIGLHRSLFLHEIGRFFVGLTAFLLLLITVSGTLLIIQRQRGLKRFFSRIARDNFAQFYHVVLGRWSLIPILIVSLTGTYLSLVRFELIQTPKISSSVDFDAIKSEPEKKDVDFVLFKNTKLSEVVSVEFPFSEDVEDYYTFKLKDREVAVNQVTGEVLSELKYPATVLLTNLSLNLHTGRASAIWAIVLAVASANILFFIYSGFAITFKRLGNRTKNKYTAEESRFILLVGSENGSTYRFAQAVHQALLKAGQKSYVTALNNYTVYPHAEYLLVLTATYGLGDAPTNAARFAALLEKHPQQQPVHYSVLGFGSHAYPDFCKFAFALNNLLSHQSWAVPLTDVHTVNDKSPADFGLWVEALAQQEGIPEIALPDDLHATHLNPLENLTVTANIAAARADGMFSLSLKPRRRLRVRSGDLLAIYPENDHRERLYSIGMIASEIRLNVRLQPNGLGSGFLNRLNTGEKIKARIISNSHFHFPDQAPEVIMISNGTGIAPFLGMIDENKKKTPCQLYCGFRESSSLEMYKSFLEENQVTKKLVQLHPAFSREGNKQYVSDLIRRDADGIANALNRGGVIMICGSLAMQKDVVELLETICGEKTGNSLTFYQSRNQIRTDCY
ncbi:PepSY domain-containing protein [Pedobacter sp. AW31-3R]|uniref:PepSY domain-containing protein n=1 Tax=Pedobacter sp. AW31-3R TaxID=3445781 RepID=UPI003FA0F2A2